jgi:alpha-beta hydrolase superfamily lysophospholipase
MVEDLYAVNRHIAGLLPGVPRVLLGHSFGSFLLQAYLFEHADSIVAAALSGTNSGGGKLARVGLQVARLEKLRVGARGRSPILHALTFGPFNKRFAPNRTEFDWLSRDPVEVDKYVADPLCGFALTAQGTIDLMSGIIAIDEHAKLGKIPKSLPLYIFAGEEDPVGGAGKGPHALAKAYERAGLQVTLRLYPGARHETLNETNKDQVIADLLDWLAARLNQRAPVAAGAGRAAGPESA